MNNGANLITLKRTDKDFKSYLLGQKNDALLALPIQSLNIGSEHEVVTFEMIQKSDLKKPNLIIYFSQLFKLNRLIYIVLPFFYVLAHAHVHKNLYDPLSAVFVFLAVLFLFIGINLRNDVIDYISGYDRVDVSQNEKPIAKGWVTANFVSKISKWFILFSVLLSLPELIIYKNLFYLFLISTCLMLAGRFLDKNYYKQKKYAEFVLFLLIGPILAAGLQFACGSAMSGVVISFSLIWGIIILFLIHVNNFCEILKSSQARISNTVTLMGFDRAKYFLIVWMIFVLVSIVIHHTYFQGINFVLFGLVPLFILFYFITKKIIQVQSPLSSDLVVVRKQAQYFFLLTVLFFIAQSLFLIGLGIS